MYTFYCLDNGVYSRLASVDSIGLAYIIAFNALVPLYSDRLYYATGVGTNSVHAGSDLEKYMKPWEPK